MQANEWVVSAVVPGLNSGVGKVKLVEDEEKASAYVSR